MRIVNAMMCSQFGRTYSDYYVAPKCIEFSTRCVKELIAGDGRKYYVLCDPMSSSLTVSYMECSVRQELLFHLFSLWDIGLIESACVDECMEIYDIALTPEGQAELAQQPSDRSVSMIEQ